MFSSQDEIYFTVIAGGILMILLFALIIVAIISYKGRYYRLLQESELTKANYEQTLLKSQLEIQEQTFTQISEEIHDNIGQVLSLVRLNLNTLGPTPAEDKINCTDELLGKAIHDLRHLSHNLNTTHIKELGLPEAIRQLLHSLHKTGQYKTSFQTTDLVLEINEEQSIILFRMVQEVINNIIKHARATAIAVVMEEENNSTRLRIMDNGKGFNTAILDNCTNGLGISNMMSRAAMIGAEVQLSSTINKGTTVFISIQSADNE